MHAPHPHSRNAAAAPSRPKEHLKPALPSKDDAPLMGLVTTKNFVVANAVENMLAPARKPAPAPPPSIAKADFGKVPAYIGDHKARLAADKQAVADAEVRAAAAAEAASGVRALSEDERAELLASLRARWQRVHTAYVKLPLACDSDPKKRRKEALEQELAQLETDIATLSRPGPVMVASD